MADRPDMLDASIAAPLLDYITDGVVVVDRDRRIRLLNPAAERIMGVKAQDAMGRSCHSLLTGSDSGVDCAMTKREPCTAKAVFETGQTIAANGSIITFPGGKKCALNMKAVPLFNAAGEVARVALIMNDVSELHELRRELQERNEFQSIIGRNHRMRELYALIDQIAETDATVTIEGESGTGKELVARAIHQRSRRKGKPFVQVNCSALVETLLESELFGHVRGAFTGAVADKVGRFEAANGGTIFLDEIGDVSPAVQVKLLRVIQERRFERVGESEPRTTDVRIITATNRHLKSLMEAGTFREDLYYRLRVVPILLPPLRERREDIPLLVESFIHRFRASMGKPIAAINPDALTRMMDYGWPGNVRELENAIEHAFVRCTGTEIQLADLPVELRFASAPQLSVPGTAGAGQPISVRGNDERSVILAALESSGGSKSLAADKLGIGRTTLWRRMKQLGIALPKTRVFQGETPLKQ